MVNIFDIPEIYLKKGGREPFFCVCVFLSCSAASALITLHLVYFGKFKISSLRALPRVSADWSQLFTVDADVVTLRRF